MSLSAREAAAVASARGRVDGRATQLRALIKSGLLEDAPFLLVVVGYALSAIVLSRTHGVPPDFELGLSLQLWYVVGASTALFGGTLFMGLLVHEIMSHDGSPLQPATWRRVVQRTFPCDKTINFAFLFLVLPFIAATFIPYKSAISGVVPFGPWDVRFMEWDRALHLGYHPWELLQPIIGHPAITRGLDFVYFLWFPVLWMTVIWQAWHGSRSTETRSQFLLAFALGWILLGTVAAMALSSAGPVYFARVTGEPDVFEGLMTYLATVDGTHDLKALWTQELLWTSYIENELSQIGGISAMPSLHVAMSTLLVLLGWKVNRLAGLCYTLFAVLIFVGSIHLGWHYALDGYLGAVAMAGIWWLSGLIVCSGRSESLLPDRS